MASQTFTIRMSTELLATVDMIGRATGSNRNAILNKFTREAIENAYRDGLNWLLVEELRENHQGKKLMPEELAEISRAVQAEHGFEKILLTGFLPARGK